jgi:uncharacterized membrane protein YdjX (TVP38/TMEM64 family)
VDVRRAINKAIALYEDMRAESSKRTPADGVPSSRRRTRLALILLPVLLLGAALALAAGVDDRLTLDAVRRHHLELLGFVAGEPVLSPVLFMAVCAIAVAISMPGVGMLTVVGGYLFGWLQGSIYMLIAATLAGILVFLVARSAFGGMIRARAGPALQRVTHNFRENALSYIFILNLVPIFPSLLVIALPAMCGVSLRTFVLAAFLGILPGTILLARLGSGLGHVLLASGPIQLSSFVTPQIVSALVGLTALALIPVVWRAYNGRAAA